MKGRRDLVGIKSSAGLFILALASASCDAILGINKDYHPAGEDGGGGTSSSAGGDQGTASTSGGMSTGTETTAGGTGGAGSVTSASSATGGTSPTLVWHSYDVTVDTSSGALSVPAVAPTIGPAAKLIAYQAGTLDDVPTRVDLTTYHNGDLTGEGLSWYVSASKTGNYPYVGQSASARTASQGGLVPLSALDLQVSLQDSDKSPVFVAFEVPIGGIYKLNQLAVRQIQSLTDNTTVVVHLKQGGTSAQVGSPLQANSDQKWQQNPDSYDITMPLLKGDQIVFEVEAGAFSSYDSIELAWTIEAIVP